MKIQTLLWGDAMHAHSKLKYNIEYSQKYYIKIIPLSLPTEHYQTLPNPF